AKQVTERELIAHQLHDPGRGARAHRVGARADPGRDHDRATAREQLEMDARDRVVGAGDERAARRRPVGGSGADRGRRQRGGGEQRDHRRGLGTSSKSARKLRAAAVAPPTSATPQASRAVVAGSIEMTTPCQKTGSEAMLAAAAIAPTTPAACTRRRPCRRTSTAASTAPTTIPPAIWSQATRPFGAS